MSKKSQRDKQYSKGSQQAHDNLEEKVVKELKIKGWENINKNILYSGMNSKKEQRFGEIDVFATKYDKYLIAVEVKSGSNNAKKSDKAIGQLYRSITRFFNKYFPKYRKFPFYVHPDKSTGDPIYEHIKFGDACKSTKGERK